MPEHQGRAAPLSGYGYRRTGQPVRRHSVLRGREGQFWKPVRRQEARQIVLAARRYELQTKEKGRRTGALGVVALEILDLLANLVDFRTGQLDPSLDTLMDRLKRSRDAIVRALANLRRHGFLDWLRRYVPTGDREGVQVQQTSNAYRLMMPKRGRDALGRYGKPSPLPADFEHAQAEHARMIDDHRQALSLAELPLFDIEDEGLAQALSRLGSLMDQRESAKRTESLSQIHNYTGKHSFPSG